jgi:hypothetical protein
MNRKHLRPARHIGATLALVLLLVQPTPLAVADFSPPDQANIQFGTPAVFDNGRGLQLTAVLVTNTGDQVQSVLTRATWITGGESVATMTGLVSNLLPGQTRVTTLGSPIRNLVPDTYDEVDFEVEVEPRTPASDDAAQAGGLVKLGTPTLSTDRFGISTVRVPVTNGDAAAHSLPVDAAFLRAGTIIGVGSGEAPDLGAGQTATVSIGIIGSVDGADQLLVTPGAVLP